MCVSIPGTGNKTLLNNPDNIATRPSGPGEHGHFLAVPPKVEFTEYETGVVYEQVIILSDNNYKSTCVGTFEHDQYPNAHQLKM